MWLLDLPGEWTRGNQRGAHWQARDGARASARADALTRSPRRPPRPQRSNGDAPHEGASDPVHATRLYEGAAGLLG